MYSPFWESRFIQSVLVYKCCSDDSHGVNLLSVAAAGKVVDRCIQAKKDRAVCFKVTQTLCVLLADVACIDVRENECVGLTCNN